MIGVMLCYVFIHVVTHLNKTLPNKHNAQEVSINSYYIQVVVTMQEDNDSSHYNKTDMMEAV